MCSSPRRVIRVCGRSASHSDTNDAIPSKSWPRAASRGSNPFWIGIRFTSDDNLASTAALS